METAYKVISNGYGSFLMGPGTVLQYTLGERVGPSPDHGSHTGIHAFHEIGRAASLWSERRRFEQRPRIVELSYDEADVIRSGASQLKLRYARVVREVSTEEALSVLEGKSPRSAAQVRAMLAARRDRPDPGACEVTPAVLEALAGAWMRDSHVHGEDHWRRVAMIGLDLADAVPGVDREVVYWFGFLHDTRRLKEGRDPDHGSRAAAYARELVRDGVLDLDDARLELLCHAIELHADGLVSDDPTVGVCWDADRLELPRVGKRVRPELLSTEAARAREALPV